MHSAMRNKCIPATKYAAARYKVSPDGLLICPDGRAIVPKVSKRGYPHVSIRVRGEGIDQKIGVHRIVAYQKFGERLFDPGIVVRHRDCNKLNFRPGNIRIGTNLENDRENTLRIKTLKAQAARKGGAMLRRFDDATVDEIRRLHGDGLGCRKLAKQFSCAMSTIHYIVVGRYYREARPEGIR